MAQITKEDFSVIGKTIKRVDGLDKTCGKPIYGQDQFPPNALRLKVVRSAVPHARIKKLDVSKAERYEGVVMVLTAKDVPGVNDVSCLLPDKPLFCGDIVRQVGDAIALIVAEKQEIAEEAADLVEVEYDPLPVIFDAREALKPDAYKIHPGGNIAKHLKVRKGDIEKGFKEADYIFEEIFTTPPQECAPLEPNVGYAVPEGDGSVTFVGSLQNPFYAQGAAAKVLGFRQDQVRVIQAQTGGAFGAKGDEVQNEMAAWTALVALKTGKPAAILYSREESIIGESKRHGFYMEYKIGVTKEGKLTAMEIKLLADTGAYASLGPFTISRAIIHSTGPYVVPNVKSDAYCTYTNNPYAGSFRGFGCPQVHFAVEPLMDKIAAALKMDPIELRRKNILRSGEITSTSQVLDDSFGLEECLNRVLKETDFHKKRKQYETQTGPIRKGIGLAVFYHGNSLGPEGADSCSAVLQVNTDGSMRYRTGITEYGTGAPSGHVQIVSEIIGVPMDYIHLERPDTAAVPDGGPTVASRSTVMGGRAAMVAAQKVKAQLNEMAAKIFKCTPEDIVIRDAKVWSKKNPARNMTYEQLVKACFDDGVILSATETYTAPRTSYDEEKGTGSPYLTYTTGAIVTEAQVDLEYGYVKVEKVTGAYDCGRALNPLGLVGQMEGGVIQGLGYGLMEEVVYKDGKIKNANLADYFIPTAMDSPVIKTILVEGYYSPVGPFGAKAMAEPSIDAPAASAVNAIFNATGVLVQDLPATPEKIVLGLTKLENKQAD